MDIVQDFYDGMACHYDKLLADWHDATREQAELLHGLFAREGFGADANLLDCACGIGTQAVGLARLGYRVTASDISCPELEEASKRSREAGVTLSLARADFRALEKTFNQTFDIIICMDNALPHMRTREDLAKAVKSITGRLNPGGIFVASIRDYDALLATHPPYSPPYIHDTPRGRRVSFQTWDWQDDCYKLTQYIIEDGASLEIRKFECEYRAVLRQELTGLMQENGCTRVRWLFPEQTGFYQPILLATK